MLLGVDKSLAFCVVEAQFPNQIYQWSWNLSYHRAAALKVNMVWKFLRRTKKVDHAVYDCVQ